MLVTSKVQRPPSKGSANPDEAGKKVQVPKEPMEDNF